MQCEKCGETIVQEEAFSYGDNIICEDCYVVLISTPKTCNPLSVRSARLTRETLGQKGTEGLLPLQKRIYDFLKEKREVPRQQVIKEFNLTEKELEKNFAVLRHCELAKGFKKDNTIYLTLMEEEEKEEEAR